MPDNTIGSMPEVGAPVGTHPTKQLKHSVVALSIFALCIDSLAVRSVILLAPFIRSALRLDDDQVGYVMAAMVAGTLVITIPAGSLLGRLDTRLAFSSMMFAVGLAFFGLSFQQSFWGLLITLFILGVFRAGIIPQVTRFITEHFDQSRARQNHRHFVCRRSPGRLPRRGCASRPG